MIVDISQSYISVLGDEKKNILNQAYFFVFKKSNFASILIFIRLFMVSIHHFELCLNAL